MKIKTISKDNVEEFDKEVSEVSIELNGKFTQTHVTNVNNRLIYTAVIFYEQ